MREGCAQVSWWVVQDREPQPALTWVCGVPERAHRGEEQGVVTEVAMVEGPGVLGWGQSWHLLCWLGN